MQLIQPVFLPVLQFFALRCGGRGCCLLLDGRLERGDFFHRVDALVVPAVQNSLEVFPAEPADALIQPFFGESDRIGVKALTDKLGQIAVFAGGRRTSRHIECTEHIGDDGFFLFQPGEKGCGSLCGIDSHIRPEISLFLDIPPGYRLFFLFEIGEQVDQYVSGQTEMVVCRV